MGRPTGPARKQLRDAIAKVEYAYLAMLRLGLRPPRNARPRMLIDTLAEVPGWPAEDLFQAAVSTQWKELDEDSLIAAAVIDRARDTANAEAAIAGLDRRRPL